MATEVISTIRASGGDYSSISAWSAGEARVATENDIPVGEMYHDWPTGLVDSTNFSGWGGTGQFRAELRAAPGHRHSGRPRDELGEYTGAAVRHTSATTVLQVGSGGVRITGLIVENQSASTFGRYAIRMQSTDGIADGCIGIAVSGAQGYAVTLGLNTAAINCVGIGTGLGIWADGGAVLNCTGWCDDGGLGAILGTSPRINCIAARGGFESASGTVENCATTDTSLPAGNGNRNSQAFSFEDADSWDFRLSPDDTGALGHGQDLSNHPSYPFAHDILGNPRTAPWDIGAFAFVDDGPGLPDTIDIQVHDIEAAGAQTGDPVAFPVGVDSAYLRAAYIDAEGEITVLPGSVVAERGAAEPVELDGSATAGASAAGDLSTAIRVAGGASAQAGAGADLTTAITLAGAALSVSAGGASMTTAIPLAGDSVAGAQASGDLATGIPLAAAAQASVSAAGNLTALIRLDGAALAAALASGSMTTAIRLSGAAGAVARATGTIGIGSGASLAGDAGAQARAGGDLSTAIPLSGAAAAAADAGAELTIEIRLAGAAVAAALAEGALTAPGTGLAGSAQASAAAGGSISTAIPLAGAALVATSATGNIAQLIELSGAAAAVVTGQGSLNTAIRLRGDSISAALAAGELTARIEFDGAALARASAGGHLSSGPFEPARERILRLDPEYRHLAVPAQSRTWRIMA